MSDLNKVASWPTFEAFVADDDRRSGPVRVPLGTCLEAVDAGKGVEEWELLWLPGTLEVVEQRIAEPRAVRLVARVRHRDYLEDVIEMLDARDEDRTARNEWLAARRGGSLFGVRNLRVNWRRYGGASALIDALKEWEVFFTDVAREDPGLPLPDYGHTRSHVDQLDTNADTWAEFDEFVGSLRAHFCEFLDDLRGDFNLATTSVAAMEWADVVVLLRSTLVEAYVVAHMRHPGKQTS